MENPIVALRRNKQLSRMDLARRAGISYPTLSTLEGGGVNKISRKTSQKIAEFSRKSPQDIEREYLVWKEEALKEAA